ncbi:hypothetical protein D9757_009140 [Collybiopsis confluens]|uniref:Uncharacterized protein n=1 Tax=Collybiopsis confluens TaxID=2823264 RepID=A0A8H5M0X6_9AGAR|nr:hypothetical protein D9757_013088 [Collybiopsis confluens]KAF5376596.1 hypothetical protein D9757_009579 [Collybiopsis confluens]KAF5378257.1 hypothetical protein D9757_009140 [Collybiopsis confluens]
MKERPEPLRQYSRKTWGVFPPTSLTTHVHWWKPNFCGVLVVPSTGGVATTASGCAIGEWFCDNGKQGVSWGQMGDNSNVCHLAHTSVTIPRYLYNY